MEYTRNFRNCRDKNFGCVVAVPEKEKPVVAVEATPPIVAAPPKKEKKAKKVKDVVEESEPKPSKRFFGFGKGSD